MKIGVTLLFKDKKDKKIIGILKSAVLNINPEKLNKEVEDYAVKIEKEMDYQYIGLNDVFSVSGDAQQGEVLGRHTFYDVININDAKKLIADKGYSYNPNISKSYFNFSSVYLCDNLNEKYTISILSIIFSKPENVVEEVLKLSCNQNFIEKIRNHSLEKINNLVFVGIEDICDIDLKDNVFQTFYASFINEGFLREELLSPKEISLKMRDIKL